MSEIINTNIKVNVSKIAYALYKQNWINGHTNSEMRMDALREYYEFLLKNQKKNLKHISFEEYLLQFGYNGCIYANYEDFCKNKYRNKDYISKLLNIPELISLYEADLELLLELNSKEKDNEDRDDEEIEL